METMTLTIRVRKDVYEILKKKAEMRGVSVEEYVEDLLEKHASELSIAEKFKP